MSAEHGCPGLRGDEELQGLFALLDRRDMDFSGAFDAAQDRAGPGGETSGQAEGGGRRFGRECAGGLLEDLCLATPDDELLASRENRQKFLRYLEDLRLVLRLPDGAGLRVLRHWLDEASAFGRIFLPAPRIFAAAALTDYARDRMAEIALADPAGHVRVQLAGARQWAAAAGQWQQSVSPKEEL